jgi:hypothetical protein
LLENTNDIQKLIDYSVSFAKTALAEFKEFYPFAAAINYDGELIPFALYEGDKFPDSKNLSTKLELLLENQLEDNKKRAFAITTDVAVKSSDSENSHDAISIKIRHSVTKEYKVYFFEYNLSEDNEVEITKSWRQP